MKTRTLILTAFLLVITASAASAERSRTITNARGGTRTASISAANGTITRIGSSTGAAGRTRSMTTTVGQGTKSTTATRRNGTTVSRSRTRIW